MRIKLYSPVEKYFTPKGSIYSDGRCYVHRDNNYIITVFSRFTDVLSKSQREWLWRITDKIARREFGENFEITEHKDEHYHLIAERKNEEKSIKKNRKKRKNKSKSKPKVENDIQG